MVCWWCHFDWSFVSLIAPVVNITSITLISNKIQNVVNILVPINPGPPGKWPLKWRESSSDTDNQTHSNQKIRGQKDKKKQNKQQTKETKQLHSDWWIKKETLSNILRIICEINQSSIKFIISVAHCRLDFTICMTEWWTNPLENQTIGLNSEWLSRVSHLCQHTMFVGVFVCLGFNGTFRKYRLYRAITVG